MGNRQALPRARLMERRRLSRAKWQLFDRILFRAYRGADDADRTPSADRRISLRPVVCIYTKEQFRQSSFCPSEDSTNPGEIQGARRRFYACSKRAAPPQ